MFAKKSNYYYCIRFHLCTNARLIITTIIAQFLARVGSSKEGLVEVIQALGSGWGTGFWTGGVHNQARMGWASRDDVVDEDGVSTAGSWNWKFCSIAYLVCSVLCTYIDV